MPFIGGVHLFDWDEINFAEGAREMIALKNYTRVHIDYVPFYEKPPLFFWLQALGMYFFGVNEFSARLPNAIFGILTMVVLYRIGTKLYNKKFGLIWTLVYFGSILPNFYFNFGIIDPVFNFFIFLSFYVLILFVWKQENVKNIKLNKGKYNYLILSGILCGLAILTKGPVAYLIVSICFFVYWLIKKFRFFISISQFLLYTLIVIIVSLIWFGMEMTIYGPQFITEFIKYNYRLFSTPGAGHSGFFGYHFVVILFGCFPASIFMFRSFSKQHYEHTYQKDFKTWMLILLCVVLVLFSIVKSKIIHYSSLAYFPVTYLAAVTLYGIIEKKITFSKTQRLALILIGGFVGILLIMLPFIGKNITMLQPYIKDEFAKANLEAQVAWNGFEALIGVILLMAIGTGIFYMNKEKWRIGILCLFIGTAITTKLAIVIDMNKIEQYSQGAAIEFFQSIANEDCYVTTVGYKSYAQLFYTKKRISKNELSHDKDWLLNGEIDKKTYFVVKIHRENLLSRYSHLEKIYEKNGFVFYQRIPDDLNRRN